MSRVRKMGVVIAGRRILTTAEHLSDLVMVRAQKGGRGKWWDLQLEWIDYHANMALLKAAEGQETFWQGMTPVALAEKVPVRGAVEVVRWQDGNLKREKAELYKPIVMGGQMTFVRHLQLKPESDIVGAGWAEVVMQDGRLVGIASSQGDQNLFVLPSSFIQSILDARARGAYTGLGYFDFMWQKGENPDTLKFLKWTGQPQGVIVTEAGEKPSAPPVFKPGDLILEVEGFPIGTEGDYKDPDYGYLNFENLATRGKWAGDTLKVKVWRDGGPVELDYTIPKAEYKDKLVPEHKFDQPPEYLIAGGLVFVPLTDELLRRWGPDWRQKAPFHLFYYNFKNPTPEHPSLVVLSLVLPDVFNIGYEDYHFLVIDRVNGRQNALAEVAAFAIPLFDRLMLSRGCARRHGRARVWCNARPARVIATT